MNKKRYILLLLTIIIFITAYIFSNIDKNKIDNYYLYINKDLLEKEKIKDGEIGWSNFTKAQDNVDKNVSSIIKELITNNTNKNITVLYNNAQNIESRNKLGIEPLKSYIDLIDNSKNIDDFINNAITIENTLGIDIFTLATVNQDFKDTSKNIVYFYPITFDFSSSTDFYTNADYSRYLALIKQYRIKILKLYGYDKKKAREVSSDLNDFYMDIATNSKSAEVLSDVDNLYNVKTKAELQKIYSNIDIDNYLKLMGISNEEYFSIVDENNYRTINKYLTNDNLDLLKEYVKIKILEDYGLYASTDYSDLISDLNNQISGITTEKDIDDYSINLIKHFFSYDIDKIYAQKYFSDEEKTNIESMINDIITYYEKEINSLDWMSKTTKDKAILKLKKMKINVGFPNDYPNYSNNYNLKSFANGSNLIENIISINKAISNYELERLHNDDKSYSISLTTVNAYYNPLDNSINFPVAIMNLYDENSSYYEKLGSIGMIIAHEITHAFDNTGSKFDEYGNRVDWWSSDDYKKYAELQEKVIDYYNKYEIIDGIHVDGQKTVGENIADLGAINCIVRISEEKKATEEDYKTLFKSYASLWASEYTDSYQKLLILMDTHAPNEVRVNAVLSSTDKFYEIYNINKNDLMYIDSENRIKIW